MESPQCLVSNVSTAGLASQSLLETHNTLAYTSLDLRVHHIHKWDGGKVSAYASSGFKLPSLHKLVHNGAEEGTTMRSWSRADP
jgi:hypothetical protein